MKVLVTGATGFLGSRVAAVARGQGHSVRALLRSGSDLTGLSLPPECIFTADVRDPRSLRGAARGIDAVIHCAAITSSAATNLEESRATNAGGTSNLIEEALRSGNPRWIQISTMSAHPGSTSVYGRTKLEADEIVRASPLAWTILRPSIIYGPGNRGMIAKTVRTARKLPIMPVIGSGMERVRPVYVDDVARAALACIANSATIGKTYMIGGKEEFTLNDFFRRLTQAYGIGRPLVHLPIPVALLIARILGRLSGNPPLTVDNVLGVMEARDVDIESAIAGFGFDPISLERGLAMTVSQSSRPSAH